MSDLSLYEVAESDSWVGANCTVGSAGRSAHDSQPANAVVDGAGVSCTADRDLVPMLQTVRSTHTLLSCIETFATPPAAGMTDSAGRPGLEAQRADLLEGMLVLFDGVEGSVQNSFVQRELLDALGRCIDRLPPLVRQILVCSRVHGMTHSEIAATLGVSRAQVETMLVRALVQCRAAVLSQTRQ